DDAATWRPRGSVEPTGTATTARAVRIARRTTVDVPVHPAAALEPGTRLAGPALVDADDTTVWIPPGHSAGLDERGSLLIHPDPEARRP
ncbi:MAG TPA: hypothetical protein VFC99_17170, partial [Acidimicrobiia bacterium]|nr:hypothetical protein [Acidimicrobiia bacterium]